jgi:predicted acetyltransferase
VNVTLREARNDEKDRAWIRAVYRDYLSELSASRSGIFPISAEWRGRDDEFLADWFRDPATHAFVILADGSRAGFARVARLPAWPRGGADFRMSDFFIAPADRRRGVGARAAMLLFSRFEGEWEVLEDAGNRAALAFWRRVIGAQSAGRFREIREGSEIRQRFRSAVRPPEEAG